MADSIKKIMQLFRAAPALKSCKISLNLPKMLAVVTYQIQIPESNRDLFWIF